VVKDYQYVELEENEEVKVVNLPFITDAMGQTFALVQKNDVRGWVNLKYLHMLPPPLSGLVSSSDIQDIRIFREGVWQPAKPYHVVAFKEFLQQGQSKPFKYDNQNPMDHIVFTIRRNGAYGGIVRIDETENRCPLADFNNVKVFLDGSWYNARPYQRWAYFDYIYFHQNASIRYYNWLGRQNPPNTVLLPDDELVDVDNFHTAIDFTISRHQSGAVYIQNKKGEILDISDNDTYRKGKVSILDQSALDFREPRPSPGGIAMPPGGIIQTYWVYVSDDGLEYKDYDQHISKILDLAYRKDPYNTNVEVNTIINGKHVSWIFNFVNMTQTNANTGSRRKIFRRNHQSYI
jgi:hypothetical protein